jgi:membrane associated rhomboid family serine protease
MWFVFFLDTKFNLNLHQYGTSPRTLKGLTGILFSPFLHSNLEHITGNSLPLLILGMLTFYFYRPIALGSFLWIFFMSGIWLWVGGRNNADGNVHHIGASGLIYGSALFLFFSGVFRRHRPLMVISALVAFLYGSMMYGIFPLQPDVSWEAHLFGAISGVLVAYNYRKEGPQAEPVIWEEDGVDFEAEEKAQEEAYRKALEQNNINIHYHFKPAEETKGIEGNEGIEKTKKD